MFENPRRDRQARNLTTNVPKILDLKSPSEQIFSKNCRWVPLIRAYSIFYLSEILIYKLHNICYCRGTLACSAGVFFGCANVLLAKAHVETRKEGRKWGESKEAG